MKTHTIEESVRYVETDRMGIVHHSTYLFWFEVARTSLLAAAGFPYHELEQSGTLFPVIEYSARMTGSAAYGDRVRIEAHIESLRSRSVEFAYKTYLGDEMIASGRTFHVAVDEHQRLHRMDPALIEALQPYVRK